MFACSWLIRQKFASDKHLDEPAEAVASPPVNPSGIARRVLVDSGKRFFRTGDGIDVWSIDRLQQPLAESTLWP
ncbi:MAG: hypothetical protein OXI87_24815 [Albidovulum sp.]|nr:hypothetical protein [Albidovulum sp.]MDE0532617.1 hypothetical protein [Albidovulum sp.]